MGWLDDNSQLNFGPHKGKKVGEVSDGVYIKWLHESNYNVWFVEEVFQRLQIQHHSGPSRLNKKSERTK